MNRILYFGQKSGVLKVLSRNVATTTKEKWDLCAGVIVERLPVITKSLEPIELEYKTHLSQIEFEQSLKSDHELKHERDKIQAELLKRGEIEADYDIDNTTKQTAQDMKDACIEEFNKFKLAPRQTEADKNNDLKSVNRKLEDNLVLLVEQKLGKDSVLVVPQGKRLDGETMRQTAERVLEEQCGKQLNVKFYGNAPCGFYKYKYPSKERNEAVGAKIFFYRCALNTPKSVVKNPKFEWLDKEEIEKKVRRSYYDSLAQVLL